MFTPEEVERYARHIVLRDVGGPGQQKLKAARVLVVGAGGLGSPILQYLAAAGIGTLGIVDDDAVSLSNLQRQVIHATADVGRPKVDSAAEAIARLNPTVTVERHSLRLAPDNAAGLVAAYDVVVDGVDNYPTRFLLADTCERLAKPLVTAGVQEFYGWLTVLKPWEIGPDRLRNPGLRSLMNEPAEGRMRTCAQVGILGVVPGVLGTLAAAEVLKLVIGIGEPLVRRMLTVDLLDMSFDLVDTEADPAAGATP
ncbi:HesA/MoeB/ThiF family protein [Siculibacillus lacustris]|uniref:HesA/MoeB/ThiF family protein n=1 Tax=Siculibacillus lacustris TaxID=1549641 RepID=A0A4Q9VRC5_9HYPH|nr:HesA/MoeB/ThiF family protein [Siculibacillus lacustris]TBW38429.1 HesA/MoeB/ThiF family protein [Siculibacillus lacustris]